MKDRDRIQVGKVADITIYNPKMVSDKSTHKGGEHDTSSIGVPYVVVNGTIVVRNSNMLHDVKSCQPIRFPVEAKGRFEPISVNRWINKNTLTRRALPNAGHEREGMSIKH